MNRRSRMRARRRNKLPSNLCVVGDADADGEVSEFVEGILPGATGHRPPLGPRHPLPRLQDQ